MRVYQIGETGREVTLYRFRPGESCVLTANSILREQFYPAIATVEEDSEAVMIPADAFRDWVRDYDVWREFVFDLVAQRLASVMAIVDEVAFRRLDERVATFLLERGHIENPISVTHQEIASELGSSREVTISFMASTTGRIVRIVAGFGLIALGFLGIGGVAGLVVAAIGLVPLIAGAVDVCVFAPLFSGPISGPEIRAGS